MKLAPIILFVYNRPEHTKKTVEALQKNKLSKESILFVFSDGPKKQEDVSKVKEVREYIKTIKGFKKVIIKESKKNKGLANSIISGVTEVINKHGKVIVLEDDLITSPAFLEYMNFLLNRYEKEKKVFSVTGYNHPPKLMKIPKNYKYDVYFTPRSSSWSWGTWKDRWENVDWEIKDFEEFSKNKKRKQEFNQGGDDMYNMLKKQMQGELDSWAIRWSYHHFKNKSFGIHPVKSYVNNIGHDGKGMNCGMSKKFENNDLNNKEEVKLPNKIALNKEMMHSFSVIYRKSFIKKVLKAIKCRIFFNK